VAGREAWNPAPMRLEEAACTARRALPYMRRFMSSVSVMHDCPSDLVEWLAKGGAQYTSCGTKIRITLYPVGSP
jgi:hypothetical protein